MTTTTYQTLDWQSLNFVRSHLYRRLANPLNNALGRLLIAQHIVPDESAQQQFQRVTYGLEVTLNVMKAWAALIHVQSGGAITGDQRRHVDSTSLPDWLMAYLQARVPLQLTFTRPVYVHPETFYEALTLLHSVAVEIGTLKSLVLRDATDPGGGVWVRAVFAPPSGGAYTSLANMLQRLDLKNPVERDTVTQVQVLRALFAINGAELRVQKNQKTGEQALAARLATAPVTRPLAPLPDASETSGEAPHQRAAREQETGESAGEARKTTAPTAAERSEDSTQSAPRADTSAPGASEPATPQTEPVRPPGFVALMQQASNETAAAANAQTDETAPGDQDDDDDTHIVPPPLWKERMIKAARAQPSVPPDAANDAQVLEVENKSDTLILPPLDWKQRLVRAGTADTPAGAASDTTPADEDSKPAARAQQAAPDAAPEPAPEPTPEVENQSETLIVPPPDLKARVQGAPAPDDAPGDADTPPSAGAADGADTPSPDES